MTLQITYEHVTLNIIINKMELGPGKSWAMVRCVTWWKWNTQFVKNNNKELGQGHSMITKVQPMRPPKPVVASSLLLLLLLVSLQLTLVLETRAGQFPHEPLTLISTHLKIMVGNSTTWWGDSELWPSFLIVTPCVLPSLSLFEVEEKAVCFPTVVETGACPPWQFLHKM